MFAILAGDKKLPLLISKNLSQKEINHIILPLVDGNLFENNQCTTILPQIASMGHFGKIIDILKKHDCNKIILAGNIIKPELKNVDFDEIGTKYIPKLLAAYQKGDDALLKEICDFFSDFNIEVVPYTEYISDLFLPSDANDIKSSDKFGDFNKAINLLKTISNFDIAQAVVIKNGYIIAIEAVEGTSNMLERVSDICENGSSVVAKGFIANAMLVKNLKDTQDKKTDIPVIGLETINIAIKAKISDIVLPFHNSIIIEKEKVIQKCKENNLNLYGFYLE